MTFSCQLIILSTNFSQKLFIIEADYFLKDSEFLALLCKKVVYSNWDSRTNKYFRYLQDFDLAGHVSLNGIIVSVLISCLYLMFDGCSSQCMIMSRLITIKRRGIRCVSWIIDDCLSKNISLKHLAGNFRINVLTINSFLEVENFVLSLG